MNTFDDSVWDPLLNYNATATATATVVAAVVAVVAAAAIIVDRSLL